MLNAGGKNISDSWILHIVLIICLIAFVAIIIALSGWSDAVRIQKDLGYDHYFSLFVGLFIITVIVERFIEVFNSIWRRRGRLARMRNIEYAENDVDKITAQRELDLYRARTETLAMYSGFAIGIIIGICGFHTLYSIFDFEALKGFQKTTFFASDIVLTAGLIAGGSKGINAVTSLVGEFLDATKKQAEARKPSNPRGKKKEKDQEE
jgi:hypothetical protein